MKQGIVKKQYPVFLFRKDKCGLPMPYANCQPKLKLGLTQEPCNDLIA
jgi:hypothetical protein